MGVRKCKNRLGIAFLFSLVPISFVLWVVFNPENSYNVEIKVWTTFFIGFYILVVLTILPILQCLDRGLGCLDSEEENPAQVPLKAQEAQSTKQVKTDQRVTVSLNETNTTSKQIPISPDERNVTVTAIKSEGKRHFGNLNTDF